MVGGLGCVGKKTALLQILDVCRLVRFANVLFCALAFIIFFLSLSSKLSAVSLSFYTCTQLVICVTKVCIFLLTGCYCVASGVCYNYLMKLINVNQIIANQIACLICPANTLMVINYRKESEISYFVHNNSRISG